MVRGLLRGDDATNSARATMRRLVRCSEERRGAMALSSGGAATFGHARTSTCTPTSHTIPLRSTPQQCVAATIQKRHNLHEERA